MEKNAKANEPVTKDEAVRQCSERAVRDECIMYAVQTMSGLWLAFSELFFQCAYVGRVQHQVNYVKVTPDGKQIEGSYQP